MELWTIFREFAHAAGPVAVTALWQGAVLACGLGLCLRFAPRASAADRFKAWGAGFAALVGLPVLSILIATLAARWAAAGEGPALPAAAAGSRPWLELDPRWSLAIAAFWLAISLWRAVDLGAHAARLRGMWKRATPVHADRRPHAAAAAKAEICTTSELDRPSVIGFLRPRILIPDWLFERLTAAELEQVVLHEAEHLRRRDDWTNLLQKLCLVLFPLNPALAWIERRLCREREMACDEAVVRSIANPRSYAACLASLAERRFEREHGLGRRAEALSLGAWRRRPELADRVHRILRLGPGLHPAAARALLAVVSCGLVAGSVEFARCPQLVAFAAPAPQIAPTVAHALPAGIAAPRMVNTRYAAAGRGAGFQAPEYRAYDAVAHVPSRAELAAGRIARARRSSVSAGSRESAAQGLTADVREAKTAARAATVADLSGVQPQQQWVVFTAWQQVETVSSESVADYPVSPASTDSNRQPVKAGAAAADAVQPAVARWTYTELIFRIEPARAGAAAASNGAKPGAAPNPSSQPSLPVPVPVRDGWLVFQL